MLTQILICVLVADFLTGFSHWIEDTYGVPSWPFIGKTVIVDNINHHRNPGMMGSMTTILSRNMSSMAIAVIILGCLAIMGWVHWTLFLTAFLGVMGNEVHNWNHDAIRNPFIVFLWDTGIIQSKKQHAKHHIPPYNKYFCTLTNFLNPVLEVLRFWRVLEWLIALFGIKPKRLSPERDGY